jgi:hypothetical protein
MSFDSDGFSIQLHLIDHHSLGHAFIGKKHNELCCKLMHASEMKSSVVGNNFIISLFCTARYAKKIDSIQTYLLNPPPYELGLVQQSLLWRSQVCCSFHPQRQQEATRVSYCGGFQFFGEYPGESNNNDYPQYLLAQHNAYFTSPATTPATSPLKLPEPDSYIAPRNDTPPLSNISRPNCHFERLALLPHLPKMDVGHPFNSRLASQRLLCALAVPNPKYNGACPRLRLQCEFSVSSALPFWSSFFIYGVVLISIASSELLIFLQIFAYPLFYPTQLE